MPFLKRWEFWAAVIVVAVVVNYAWMKFGGRQNQLV